MKNLDGKVAIVTGAATGIGYGISKRLANDGANLVMVDLDANMMEQSASEIAARTQEVKISIGDVSEPKTAQEAVNKAINEWGKIDILVNNAGIGGVNGNIWELDVEEMDRVYRTNLRGVFSFCHEVVPHMLENDYGRIVNIASIAGKEGNPRMVPYSSTKAAVIGLTKSIGKELAGTGVLANCVTPAVVQTRILEEFTPEQVQYMVDRIPIGRTGEISEIAALVAWLSSDECSFSTGAVFDISGGRATY
ncbi:MAG TPA: 3-oxoacyl-ACP reductase [Dehalococcoidia bacterium]|jgi:3-oxoacyl-[acyl-carrier protein] reductase|uniref:3-oxoacyl-ACP reductase n=1 Tax=marine metagenome TaxID=408172 RepID=A0A381Y4V4_9ZZZZ|nr:3-oxoacyl-ACP reductase [Dehalococcoidia bacterium]HBR64810.1 3-oxoacyl-ACP reductase [Dehalococcoidia bacterium]|tara:strand:+ start:2010 stop:2759 length:750 start_codon:yes stop_codon:yes gene_type:complete